MYWRWQSFGISLETSYFGVDEDADGVTLGSDALATAPPPAMPMFPGSYRVAESFPKLTSTSFTLPTLFGLPARGVEISRAGDFPCMFMVLSQLQPR